MMFIRSGFSPEALRVLAARPQKGATTDVVARRLIAGALDGDTKLSKEQLRQIRAKERAPPAPAMPTLLTDSESEEAARGQGEGGGREDSRPKEGTARHPGGRLLAGALRGMGGPRRPPQVEAAGRGVRNALFT